MKAKKLFPGQRIKTLGINPWYGTVMSIDASEHMYNPRVPIRVLVSWDERAVAWAFANGIGIAIKRKS